MHSNELLVEIALFQLIKFNQCLQEEAKVLPLHHWQIEAILSLYKLALAGTIIHPFTKDKFL